MTYRHTVSPDYSNLASVYPPIAKELSVHRFHGHVGRLEGGEVDERESLAAARVRVAHDLRHL